MTSPNPTSTSSLLSMAGLSNRDKRTVVLVTAGGVAWFGCCAAAYVAWRNYQGRRESFFNGSPSITGNKSQKSQFVINELRKVNEEMTALRQDVNGVKVLVKQLRRDIAELRCLERNGAISFNAGQFMQPVGSSNNEFHPIADGYNEDDESELEFRSAKSENWDAASRCKSPVRFAPINQNSYQRSCVTSPAPSEYMSCRDITSPLTVSASDSDLRTILRNKRSSSEQISPEVYAEIDAQLDLTDNLQKRDTLRRLEEFHTRDKHNPDVMWRLGRALYYESEVVRNEAGNPGKRRDIAYRAKDLCFDALSRINEPSAGVFKWCALTLGNLQEFESISNKIKQGYEFRTLIEKAIELEPNDPLAHYLLGRWFFGCYQLTWYERKIAATLFATPPSATVDEALGEFLKCSELLQAAGQPDWKENCLYIAKCYIEKRDTSGEVSRWLKAGEYLPDIDEESRLAGQEIAKLIAQGY